MIVTTVPVQTKPDVVITLSWDEAQILATVCGGIGGADPKNRTTENLYYKLSEIGLSSRFEFEGHFK